jgi:hypothetical protein
MEVAPLLLLMLPPLLLLLLLLLLAVPLMPLKQPSAGSLPHR